MIIKVAYYSFLEWKKALNQTQEKRQREFSSTLFLVQ